MATTHSRNHIVALNDNDELGIFAKMNTRENEDKNEDGNRLPKFYPLPAPSQ